MGQGQRQLPWGGGHWIFPVNRLFVADRCVTAPQISVALHLQWTATILSVMGARESSGTSAEVAQHVLAAELGPSQAERIVAAGEAGAAARVRSLVDSSAPSRRKVILGALAALLPLAAWHGIGPSSGTSVSSLAPDVVAPTYEADQAVRHRMYPRWAVAQEPGPVTVMPWAPYVETLATHSAASASTFGIPETPSRLVKRITRYRRDILQGRSPSPEETADLARAVRFWDQYWVEKEMPWMRWVRSPLNTSPVDPMSAEDAATHGVQEAKRAREAFLNSVRQGEEQHFAFFEQLKDAVSGTPLADALPHFSDRRTEVMLATLPGPLPTVARFMTPFLPPVTHTPGAAVSAAATAANSIAREGHARPMKPFVSAPVGDTGLTGPRGGYLCGPLAEVCGTGPVSDTKAALVRKAWDTHVYDIMQRPAFKLLHEIHEDSPVYISPEAGLLMVLGHGEGGALQTSAVLDDDPTGNVVSGEKYLASILSQAMAREEQPSKIVVSVGRFTRVHGSSRLTDGHALLLVLDLERAAVQLFDPHGQTSEGLRAGVESVHATLEKLFESAPVVEALQGQQLHVATVLQSEEIAKNFRDRAGPQRLHNALSTGHEGSCQLWALWFAHALAQFPDMAPVNALDAATESVLWHDDVDSESRASVKGAPGSLPPSPSQQVRVADALHRGIQTFGTQLLSLMPDTVLQGVSAAMGARLRMAADTHAEALLKMYADRVHAGEWKDGAPADPEQRVRWLAAAYRQLEGVSMGSRLPAADLKREVQTARPLLRALFGFWGQTGLLQKIRAFRHDVGTLLGLTDAGVKPSSFNTQEEAPVDVAALADAAMRVLKRFPRTDDPSTLHRLLRLRMGFLTPRYVADASEEAFGTRKAPPGDVLRFLQATEFLEGLQDLQDYVQRGEPTELHADPTPSLWRRMATRATDFIWDRGSDSYRNEVATGSFGKLP